MWVVLIQSQWPHLRQADKLTLLSLILAKRLSKWVSLGLFIEGCLRRIYGSAQTFRKVRALRIDNLTCEFATNSTRMHIRGRLDPGNSGMGVMIVTILGTGGGTGQSSLNILIRWG